MVSSRAQSIIDEARRRESVEGRLEGLLPEWVEELRPHQVDAIEEIAELYRGGHDLVVVDAPTGAGKTLIGEAVRLLLGQRGVYICSSKSLQEQFVKDFEYAKVLKGRSNYPTLRRDLYNPGAYLSVTAGDCTKRRVSEDSGSYLCDWCGNNVSGCPYEIAKSEALRAELACLNSTYFLTEANGPGRFGRRDFVVVDECDLLESEVMKYVGVDVSERRVERLGLGEPSKVTKEDAWIEWADEAGRIVQEAIRDLPEAGSGVDDVRQIREAKYLALLYESLDGLKKRLREGGWIYTGKNGRVSFKPIRVNTSTQNLLWQHSKKWLLMSATVVSPGVMLEELGWSGKWGFVSVPSIFPVKNRPIKYFGVASLNRESRDNGGWERMGEGIKKVIARHPGERVLVHTVSYDFTKYLVQTLARNGSNNKGSRLQVFHYANAAERDKAIRGFIGEQTTVSRSSGGRIRSEDSTVTSVLLAPSLDRGIDLPDDKCRAVIIAKIPFPFLGDRQVSARLYSYGGQAWYASQTIRSLIQMSGRGVRHEEDKCTTYILDKKFQELWSQNRNMFPSWWRDAVDWSDRLE